MIGTSAVARLVSEVRAALRRRPAHEAKLAGTLRAVAAHSPELMAELLCVVETLGRRGSYGRPLYSAAVRVLSEQGERSVTPLLVSALTSSDAGGLPSLAAACFSRERELTAPLSRAALNRHPVLAFAAEVARLARGESRGGAVASLAPKIKEAHRIALCSELFFALLGDEPLPVEIAPALAVLRDAERHLGRWLLLGELATRAGDPGPLSQAKARALAGPESARAAWMLVSWALQPTAVPPQTRPTLELIARLSDRPSAERDPTFLFRLAAARAPSARPVLETLARGPTLKDEVSVRAALHLWRDYGEESRSRMLAQTGKSPRKDALRGLAAAALYDGGACAASLEVVVELSESRHLPALGWSALVRAASAGARPGCLVSERNFRRVQQGASA